MTDTERTELRDQLFQQLQLMRWGLDQIGAGADKPALVVSRTGTAQKMLKRFEDDLRTLLGMNGQADIAQAILDANGHLGARRDR